MKAIQSNSTASAEADELSVSEGRASHLEVGARAIEGFDPRKRELQQRNHGNGPGEAGASAGGESVPKHDAERGRSGDDGSRAC